jgi:ABC-type polysaccharide/polyol phosphate transport system ATPase subunit
MNILPAGPALQVEDLGKRFQVGVKQEKESVLATTRRLINGSTSQRELWALRHVSFKVDRGETLGVIGPNGAGKSTLLLLLSQILSPTEGKCLIDGKPHCFFRIGAALQPRLTVLENFSLCCTLLGLDRNEFRRRLPDMIAFSGLEDYLYARYGELSSGLAARLPFAAAVHTDLHTILVDEMLTVGDRIFQAKCLKTFHDFKAQGKTLVIVSHSLPLIESLCARTLYLNAGKMMFLGDSAAAVRMLIKDMGEAGQPDPRPSGGEAAGKPGFQSHIKVGKIVEAAAHRIRAELDASTEERRGAVSREFIAGGGADALSDKPIREIIDAKVRSLGPELRKSIEAAGVKAAIPPAADKQPPATEPGQPPRQTQLLENIETEISKVRVEFQTLLEAARRDAPAPPPDPKRPSLQVQIHESVDAELLRIRNQVEAVIEGIRKAGEREREAWLASLREISQFTMKASRTEVPDSGGRENAVSNPETKSPRLS